MRNLVLFVLVGLGITACGRTEGGYRQTFTQPNVSTVAPQGEREEAVEDKTPQRGSISIYKRPTRRK